MNKDKKLKEAIDYILQKAQEPKPWYVFIKHIYILRTNKYEDQIRCGGIQTFIAQSVFMNLWLFFGMNIERFRSVELAIERKLKINLDLLNVYTFSKYLKILKYVVYVAFKTMIKKNKTYFKTPKYKIYNMTNYGFKSKEENEKTKEFYSKLYFVKEDNEFTFVQKIIIRILGSIFFTITVLPFLLIAIIRMNFKKKEEK